MAQSYLATRISPDSHRSYTPENFLLVTACPIARTGVQRYTSAEIGIDTASGFVDVVRQPWEVFSARTMASGESKPICDSHPGTFVGPHNAIAYAKGTMRNLRRGEALDDGTEPLLADLLIMDKDLISKVESGQRSQISLGYSCSYSQDSHGRWQQSGITINHCAICEAGRAGPSIRVLDADAPNDFSFAAMAKQYHRRNPSEVKLDRPRAVLVRDSKGQTMNKNDEAAISQKLDILGALLEKALGGREQNTARSMLRESRDLETFLKGNPGAGPSQLHEFVSNQFRERNANALKHFDGTSVDDDFARAANARGRELRGERDCRSNLRRAEDSAAATDWEQAMNERGKQMRERL